MTDAEIESAEQLARRVGCANCWTGTAGSLAAATIRLIRDHQEKDDMTHQDTSGGAGEQLLRSAIEAIAARRPHYGPPAEHFARTIGAFNALFAHKLKEPLAVTDWPIIMSLDKFARELGPQPHPDNGVDVVGYMACRAECEGE